MLGNLFQLIKLNKDLNVGLTIEHFNYYIDKSKLECDIKYTFFCYLCFSSVNKALILVKLCLKPSVKEYKTYPKTIKLKYRQLW